MEVKSNTKITFTVNLELDEQEARALNAITIYGSKQFLEFFYKSLGRSYLEPYEKGLISLFAGISNKMPVQLKKFDDVSEILNNSK